MSTHTPSRSDCHTWKKEPSTPSPSSSRSSSSTTPSPNQSDCWDWSNEVSFVNVTLMDWPPSGRPLPEQDIVEVTPGIIGRAPPELMLIEKSESQLLQEPSEQYDPAHSTKPPATVSAHAAQSLQSNPEHSDTITAEQSSAGQDNANIQTPGVSDAILAKWQAKVVEFLNQFHHPDHESQFYQAYLKMLEGLKCFDFTIDFDHLLSWDRNLAYIVCNGQGRDDQWLRQSVSLFMNGKGLASQAGKVNFVNMPSSLRTGRDTFSVPENLVMPVALFKGREVFMISSFRCSQILDAMMSGLLARLRTGASWCGKLTNKDLEFTELAGLLRVIIRKDPEVHENATGKDKALDVNSLWPMVEAVVTYRGCLPLYFKELKNDLLGATADEVTQDWFREYLCYHPALMSSMARRELESGMYQVVNHWHLDLSPSFQTLFADKPMKETWCDLACSDRYLKVNYDYASAGSMPRNKKSEKDGVVEEKKDAESKYANTMLSLLEFKRHVNQHPRVKMNDLDESEVYLASQCSEFLPKLIKGLLCSGLQQCGPGTSQESQIIGGCQNLMLGCWHTSPWVQLSGGDFCSEVRSDLGDQDSCRL